MENKTVQQELIAFYNQQYMVFKGARETRDIRPEGRRILNAMRTYMESLYRAVNDAVPGTLLSPDQAIVEDIKEQFPAGCRVVLDRMDDLQAPPIGTAGTVHSVDDTGSIMVSWDAGGSLHVVYGADKCHRLYPVKCADNQPVTLAEQFHAGDRIMLDKDITGIIPSGTVGSVQFVAGNAEIAMRWDGYRESALIPGKDRFHRVFDTVSDPIALAQDIHKFCEATHYRQSPTIIGYWQPGALLEMTIDQLYSFSGINRIIRGIYHFRNTAGLSQEHLCWADKILHDLFTKYAVRGPMVAFAKDTITDFIRREYRDNNGGDFTDLCAIPVANTTLEDGREVQSVVDLVMYQIRTYVDGTLVETTQHDDICSLVIHDLRRLDFDTLVSFPDGKEAGMT